MRHRNRRSHRRNERKGKIQGKYCVIIPGLNVEKNIGDLVKRLKHAGLEVVVVDDGSRDETVRLSSEQGAVVISHVRTQGKGRALKTGFRYALRNHFDAVVTMDGDGQHDPRDVIRLIYEAERQHAALVIGNRMHAAQSMPGVRYRTNRMLSGLISRMAGNTIPDTQCGLRLIRREVLQDRNLKSNHFELESEIILLAAKHRWKIISVPVKCLYRGQRSGINPVLDALRFFKLVTRYMF